MPLQARLRGTQRLCFLTRSVRHAVDRAFCEAGDELVPGFHVGGIGEHFSGGVGGVGEAAGEDGGGAYVLEKLGTGLQTIGDALETMRHALPEALRVALHAVDGFGEEDAGVVRAEDVLLLGEVVGQALQALAQGLAEAGFGLVGTLVGLLQASLGGVAEGAFGGEFEDVLMMIEPGGDAEI